VVAAGLLLGAKQTSRNWATTSVFDPQRTSGPILRLRPLLLHFSFKDLTKPALWTAAMSRVSSASSWRDRRYRFEAVAAQGGLTFLRHHVSNEA